MQKTPIKPGFPKPPAVCQDQFRRVPQISHSFLKKIISLIFQHFNSQKTVSPFGGKVTTEAESK
jgi:hypothetical protein